MSLMRRAQVILVATLVIAAGCGGSSGTVEEGTDAPVSSTSVTTEATSDPASTVAQGVDTTTPVAEDEPTTEAPSDVNGVRVGLGRIRDLALSPDESLIVAGGDHRLWLVELPGLESTTVDLVDDTAASVAFDPSGSVFAVGLESGSIQIWDVASRQQLRTVQRVHGEWANLLTFSDDGRLLASFQRGPVVVSPATVVVLDVATGETVIEIDDVVVDDLALDAKGMVLAGADGGEIMAWDVDTGEEIGRTRIVDDDNFYSTAAALEFDDDGSTLFIFSGYDQPLRSLDTGTWSEPVLLSDPLTDFPRSMVRRGRDLFVGMSDATVTRFDADGPSDGHQFTIADSDLIDGVVDDLDVVGDTLVAFVPDNEDIVIYDLAVGAMLDTISVSAPGVRSIGFDSSGEQLFLQHSIGGNAGNAPATLTLWDLSGTNPELIWREPQTARAQFTDDGNLIAATPVEPGSYTEQLIDLDTGEVIIDGYEELASREFVYDADLGRYARHEGEATVVYDYVNDQLVQSFPGTERPDELVLSPDGRHLARIVDTTLQVWDLDSGAAVFNQSFPGLEKTVEFTSGGFWVLAEDDAGDQHLLGFEIGSDTALTDIALGNTDDMFRISPDGQAAAVLVTNILVHVIDLASGDLIGELRALSPITDIAYSPDGATLAMGGISGTVLLAPVPTP